jgi:hypothetical protein
VQIACIVEGDGEHRAVPALVTRIIQESHPDLYVQVFTTMNFRGRDKFQNLTLVQRAVENAARRVGTGGAVLILRDADSDCPVTEASRLIQWARESRSDVHLAVVIAKCEYEAWFLAAAESLRGRHGLRPDLLPPVDAEAVRDAKGWLTNNMQRAKPYSPTTHQASFSQTMSLEEARTAPSFDKLCRDVRRLVEAMQARDA